MKGRAEPTSYSVADLLQLAREGGLRPLPFPRAEPWGEPQRIEFLDNLLQGLPAGALILGRRAAEAGEVRLGRWQAQAPSHPEALWIVDGQQRLGALAGALRGAASGEARAGLDPLTGRLVHERRDDDRQGELPGLGAPRPVPIDALLEPAALLRWLRLHPPDEEAIERVLEASERLRTCRLAAYLMPLDDPERVRAAFERANGERLGAVDRFGVRTGTGAAGAGGAGGEGPLGRLSRSLAGLGFGRLEEDAILRALRAIAGDEAETAAAQRQAEAALRRAVIFLQVNGAIPHVAALPYALPLVVLARYLHEFPKPQPSSRERLRRWLWRASLGLGLSGAGRHLDAIVPGDEEGSARRLLALAPASLSPEVFEIDRFHGAHARSKLQLCALASLQPRDLSTGASLDPAALFADPPPLLLDDATGPHAAGLANRLLHPRLAPGAAARLLAEADDAVLTSHAIPPEAQASLRSGDGAAVLAARAPHLRRLLERFFARQAEWGVDS